MSSGAPGLFRACDKRRQGPGGRNQDRRVLCHQRGGKPLGEPIFTLVLTAGAAIVQ